ncbi:uncharacterized protein C2845_PM17G01400 [Panicum miliaceum]|uniref:Bifunctional endo-1,4-beta-xylanase XylA-like n=1 Tax=Panicum miliaceum TaxID=4540 RepID=A0A3L6Q4X7_PANMI|nr:uncharacterized protein C2845_PM17G01400 [Panicum miliaceum]
MEFCSYVGNISWHRFCENKQYVSVYNNLDQWDDSGAFENFQNSKARFWANYHGQPSDIPLPDPDMYTDKVDHRCNVDPELVANLDKVLLPFDSDYSSTPATGSGNAGADNKCTQSRSGNWDIYIEKPAEVNKWEWDANAIWGGKDESSSKWGNSNSGWGASLQEPSWRGWSNNQYISNNRNNNFYGGSNNNRYREEDPSHASEGNRTTAGTSSRGTINRGARMRGTTKEAAGRIIEEETENGVHCTTRACRNGQGIDGGSLIQRRIRRVLLRDE